MEMLTHTKSSRTNKWKYTWCDIVKISDEISTKLQKNHNTNEIEMFSLEEMQSPFEAIRETDGGGHEWWNSRKLARLMQLSTAIKKSLNPSDNCVEQGVLLYNLDAKRRFL